MSHRSKKLQTILFCLLISALAGHAQAQTLAKAADLKAEPAADAKTLKSLPANAAAKMLKRQGFWAEIEVGGAKGWVKLSEISMGASGASAISTVDTGRTGKGNIVSTSAARGLSAKELVAAKADPQQFEQLKSLAVSASEAETFAQSSGLKNRTLALLATPAGQPAAASSSANNGSTNRKASKKDDDDEDD